jgi:hypothetical protein
MVFAVLLFAAAAAANPIAIEMYVDFDPPNVVHRVDPPAYSTLNAYIVADLGYMGEDVYAVSFDVDVMFGAAVITGSFVPSLPIYTVQIVDNGIIVTNESCFDTWPATLGYVPIFYTGVPDIVRILPHIYNGHTYAVCGSLTEYDWCYAMDGGIGMEPQLEEYCGNPIEDMAWGAIKAMYR